MNKNYCLVLNDSYITYYLNPDYFQEIDNCFSFLKKEFLEEKYSLLKICRTLSSYSSDGNMLKIERANGKDKFNIVLNGLEGKTEGIILARLE